MSSPPAPAPGPLTLSVLADYYAAQSQQIQQNFEETNAGTAVLRARSDLVDALVIRLYQEFISADPQEPRHLCLLALGGYGRRELFPHSDIDLLFLTEDGSAQSTYRDAIATLLRMLWDLRMRVGNSTHTLAECGRLYRDNLEFNVSLLDLRYLAGDAGPLYTPPELGCPPLGGAGPPGPGAQSGGTDGPAPCEVRQHDFPSGAQPQRCAGLPARLSRLPMARPH